MKPSINLTGRQKIGVMILGIVAIACIILLPMI